MSYSFVLRRQTGTKYPDHKRNAFAYGCEGIFLKAVIGIKKIKKKLIVGALIGSIFLCALALFGTGLFAVYTLVAGLVEQLPDGGYKDGSYEDRLTESDLSGYNLDEMIAIASDEKVFTDDMLDSMFMERATFENLLQRVKEYNESFDEADKTIGRMHYWYETVTTEGPPDENGNPTTSTTTELRSAEEPYDYHVKASDYEDHYYQKIEWPSLYVSAVADVLTGYQVQAQEIQQGGSVADNSAESGKLVSYASKLIGKTSYTNLKYMRDVFSHFGLELPLDAKTVADAFADPVGAGVCVPFDEIADKLQNGDILCFAAPDAFVVEESTLARTYTGSGEDIILGIYAGNDTVLICESGKVMQKKLSDYKDRFYSARRTAMSEDAKNTVEIEGEEVVKSDGYTGNRIGDYVGNWVGQNDYERAQNEKYTVFIEEAAKQFNLPPDLIRANISAESGWNPDSKNSTSTASGLMQILDGTWDSNCVKCGYPAGEYSYKCDPRASIMVGAAVLNSYVYGCAKGDLVDGMGIYHFGENGYKKRGGKTGGLSATEVKKISLFCNKQFTLADLQSGAFDSVADGYTGIGYMTTNGRLMLTAGQLDMLINIFRTYFTYAFDVVRDPQITYSYSECMEKPNYGKKISGVVGDDWYEWYEPVSQLDLAEAPWLDVYYAYLNIESDKVVRHDRWTSNQMTLWDSYDGTWYSTLVNVLPLGDDAIYRYKLYSGMAKSIIEYDKDSTHILYAGAGADTVGGGVVNGSTINWASGGGYQIPDGYNSIQIPESAGGMSIPLYLQYDGKWGQILFGGGNIGSSGCGATSMAMVVTYLTGKQVTPDMVVAKIGNRYYTPGAGQSWDMPGGVAAIFGIQLVTQCTANAEKILQYLKAGYPVVVSTTGKGTTQEFTKNGHYIVLRGLDEHGKVLVNDPNDNTSTKQHYLKSYDVNFIVGECTENRSNTKPMWVFSK